MNAIQHKKTARSFLAVVTLACSGLFAQVQAVTPTPDGCYPSYTTAEGCNALQSLTTGVGNTGIGWYSVFANSIGNYNTGVGAGTLDLNNADNNTAVGAAALLLNTNGNNNTATGVDALVSNSTGIQNTANGAFALYSNGVGSGNIAIGYQAGYALSIGSNDILIGNIGVPAESDTIRIGDQTIHAAIFLAGITEMSPEAPNQAVLVNPTTGQLGSADISTFGVVITDPENTAVGDQALSSNTGESNTAIGFHTLMNNTTGVENSAVGSDALVFNSIASNNNAFGAFALFNNDSSGAGLADFNNAHGRFALQANIDGSENNAFGDEAMFSNTTGSFNTGLGDDALFSCTTGSSNVAIGDEAGTEIIHANNVTCIGAGVAGTDVSNTTWIGNVYGVTTQSGTTMPVIVSDTGQLGTVVSSERFKKDIATMEKASEAILSLRPVTFHYKTDATATPQFGLIAEEVAKVNHALVLPDKEGKPYIVRYDAVNAMLLNEFLKEHRKNEDQGATIAQQQKEIEELKAELKKQASQIQKVSAQIEMSTPAPQTVLNSQ